MTADAVKAPMLGALFYLALIIPLEFSFTVAGLRLSPYRVFLLALMIPMVLRERPIDMLRSGISYSCNTIEIKTEP